MQFLFDSRGYHIANLVNGQLHSPRGANIGHFLSRYGIFIDMCGRYLGEIIHNDRFMANQHTPYRNTNLGIYGNYGNVGNYGNPGNHGNIGTISGYKDIDPSRLEE